MANVTCLACMADDIMLLVGDDYAILEKDGVTHVRSRLGTPKGTHEMPLCELSTIVKTKLGIP